MEYYSAVTNDEISPFATTGIDLDRIILSEVSQVERQESYIPIMSGM